MIVLALALLAAGIQAEFPVGQRVPAVTLIDDSGRTRSLDEFRGQPVIVAPLYTRCMLACPLIASGLKRAAAESKTLPSTYRVIVFSFDARDTPADLRRFREKYQFPISWTVATASPADVRRLTDALGYRFAEAPGGFTHPNAIAALTPDLVTARFLHGTAYPAADFDAALSVARGGIDWVGRFGPVAIAFLLFAATLAGGYLVLLVTRRKSPPNAENALHET